jgi:hypothetical protein
MAAMITTISTLASRVAFHATPGLSVSLLALTGPSFRVVGRSERRTEAAGSAMAGDTLRV